MSGRRIGIDDTGWSNRVGTGWIFVPYCKLMIYLNGELQELPENMRDLITDYDYQTEESGASTLSFTVADPEFVLLNSSMIIEDVAVYFEFGWANDWNYIKRWNGYISTIDIEFTSDGYPELSITCMDETHKMNREEKSRTFKNMKRSAIVKQIFDEYGIPSEVHDSGERSDDIEEEITQSNQTDIDFLQSLADEVIGAKYICYVEDGKGYFGERDLAQEPILDFHYRDQDGNDVSSFSVEINKEKIKTYKTTSDVSTSTGTTKTTTASTSSSKTKTSSSTKSASNSTPKNSGSSGSNSSSNSSKKSGKTKTFNPQTGHFE